MGTPQTLPQDVVDAIARGHTLDAIQRLRAAMAVDLKTAHAAVEAYARGEPLPPLPAPSSPLSAGRVVPDVDALPADVRDALRTGHKIEAIKRLREATGLGLREAKDLIDAHDFRAAPAADAPIPAVVSGREGFGFVGWVALIAVAGAGAVAWWFQR